MAFECKITVLDSGRPDGAVACSVPGWTGTVYKFSYLLIGSVGKFMDVSKIWLAIVFKDGKYAHAEQCFDRNFFVNGIKQNPEYSNGAVDVVLVTSDDDIMRKYSNDFICSLCVGVGDTAGYEGNEISAQVLRVLDYGDEYGEFLTNVCRILNVLGYDFPELSA